jgi:hypothetical protein
VLLGAPGDDLFGGKGANHFDSSLSALGFAKGVVMDYSPTKGDTISGPCKVVNTLATMPGMPAALPNTGESGGGSSGSTSSSMSEIVACIPTIE